jgi:hypothetical protein
MPHMPAPPTLSFNPSPSPSPNLNPNPPPSRCAQFARFCGEGIGAVAAARAVPAKLLPLLQRMLSSQPAARPTAAEVHAALAASLSALTPLAEWASPMQGQGHPCGAQPGASQPWSARVEAHGAAGAAGAAGGAEAEAEAGRDPRYASGDYSDGSRGGGSSGGGSSSGGGVAPTSTCLPTRATTRPPALLGPTAAATGGGKVPMAASSSSGDGSSASGAASSAASSPCGSACGASPCGSACGAGGTGGAGGASGGGASGGGGGGGGEARFAAAFAPMHPPPPVRRSPDDGYVRCLGWESLPFPAGRLATAVASTLDAMHVAYTADPRRHCVDVCLPPEASPLLPSPPLGLASLPPSTTVPPVSAAAATAAAAAVAAAAATATATASPAAAAAPAAQPHLTACDLHGVQQHGARGLTASPGELHVSITIFGDEVGKETHHVDVRRRGGPHWQFQRFYIRFRELVRPPLVYPPHPPPPHPRPPHHHHPSPHPTDPTPHHHTTHPRPRLRPRADLQLAPYSTPARPDERRARAHLVRRALGLLSRAAQPRAEEQGGSAVLCDPRPE